MCVPLVVLTLVGTPLVALAVVLVLTPSTSWLTMAVLLATCVLSVPISPPLGAGAATCVVMTNTPPARVLQNVKSALKAYCPTQVALAVSTPLSSSTVLPVLISTSLLYLVKIVLLVLFNQARPIKPAAHPVLLVSSLTHPLPPSAAPVVLVSTPTTVKAPVWAVSLVPSPPTVVAPAVLIVRQVLTVPPTTPPPAPSAATTPSPLTTPPHLVHPVLTVPLSMLILLRVT